MNEEQKQSRDNIAAYNELIRWDNWGIPENKSRRQFENLIVVAHNEKNTGKLPDSESIVAWYSQRYGFPYIPPKLSQFDTEKLHAEWLAKQKKLWKAEDRKKDREHAKSMQAQANKHGYVQMTFGGSHREIQRIARLIKSEGIRTSGSDYPVSLKNWKRRHIDVHKDDVEKARKIGMSVRKG